MKIDRKYSPNKSSRNGYIPDMIVSHITEGSYQGAVAWLCNPRSQASSHFVVSQKGEVTQLLDIREASWCNGTSTNKNSKTYYGNSSLKKVRNRRTNANRYTITIEHEGFSNQTQGALTSEQYKATLELHKHIRSEVKRIYNEDITLDRENIVGHYQINPVTKPDCPGRLFPFDRLLKDLKGGSKEMTEEQVRKIIKEELNKQENDETIYKWSKEAIAYVKEKGIMKGYADGTFKPNKPITRAEVAQIIYNLRD